MKKIGLITSVDDPNLCADDRLVLPHLLKLGIEAHPFIWDRDQNFDVYEALVFRSCWNYHRKYDEFLMWLDRLEKSGKKVLNPVVDSRWNLHKKYLFTLKEKGIPVPETILIPKNSPYDLKKLLTGIKADKLVIKPAVSMNGLETTLRQRSEISLIETDLGIILQDRDAFIQEFIPEIKEGEISLVYLHGKFSHASRKIPAENEFRVHNEYGGRKVPFLPDDKLLHEIQKIISLKPHLLFSRVDIALIKDSWTLIEWEIIDPMLYLADNPGAAEKFADAVSKGIQ